MSKLRSEPHVNAQILPCDNCLYSEKFLVILAYFCVLLGVFDNNVFVHYILGSIQRFY